LLCLRNARAFPLLPAALASVPFGFVLVRVRVPLTGEISFYRNEAWRGNGYNSTYECGMFFPGALSCSAHLPSFCYDTVMCRWSSGASRSRTRQTRQSAWIWARNNWYDYDWWEIQRGCFSGVEITRMVFLNMKHYFRVEYIFETGPEGPELED